jgi:ABC-type amino acid transport substrate-binding protein
MAIRISARQSVNPPSLAGGGGLFSGCTIILMRPAMTEGESSDGRALVRAVGIVLSLLGWVAAAPGPPALADAPLRVCLQADDPPLSSRRSGEAAGFDVAVAKLMAERLERSLEIQWFTTRDDPDSNPVTEADALLADGHCTLVAGYPLVADQLGRPRAGTGKLPPFDGSKPDDRRRWISLGELVPTRPYRFDAITVALSPARSERSVQTLADLRDLKIGVEVHGLPDLIAMTYREGQLVERVVHFDQSRALFAQLESGDIDAALIGQREFDAWRLAYPATLVAATGYRHSIGFNIGFVGLSTSGALIERVDAILTDLLADGSLIAIAQSNALTYLPPRTPDVSPGVSFSALGGD